MASVAIGGAQLTIAPAGLEGGAPTPIGIHAGNISNIDVSADGRRFAYSSVVNSGEVWKLDHPTPVDGER